MPPKAFYLVPDGYRLYADACADAARVIELFGLPCDPADIVRSPVSVQRASQGLFACTSEPVVSTGRESIRRALRLEVLAGGRCEYCFRDDLLPRETWEVDHRLPVCRGGATMIWNLGVACSRCNHAKWNRLWAPGERREWSLRLQAPPGAVAQSLTV
jgi:5-methylcytosine-specific restriction endonuclease McrA